MTCQDDYGCLGSEVLLTDQHSVRTTSGRCAHQDGTSNICSGTTHALENYVLLFSNAQRTVAIPYVLDLCIHNRVPSFNYQCAHLFDQVLLVAQFTVERRQSGLQR